MNRLTQLGLTAATIAAGIGSEGFVEIPEHSDKHPAIKGRVVGHDMGKPLYQIQERNSKCLCGSGKKAKMCCVVVPQEKLQ